MKTKKCETAISGPSQRGEQRGFTLFEVIAAVAVLAVIVGVGVSWGGRLHSASAGTGLKSHLRMLNSAVDVYLANSGDLSTVSTGAEVIKKLQSVADGASAKRINGLRGSALDQRLKGVPQSAAEAASSQMRVRWNPGSQRFELKDSGSAGFRKFVFDSVVAPVAEETRQPSLALASTSKWVWDYNDNSLGAPTMNAPTAVTPPLDSTPPTTVPPGALILDPPTFSIPGGTYEYSAFGLDLHFIDTNPTGVSQVFYSINGGTWASYSGDAIVVQPDDRVLAHSVSLDPDGWLDSAPVMEEYAMTFTITGATSGLFTNPVGGPDMVTGGWGNYFTWGTPATWDGFTDPSWLLYEGASFIDVSEGERFLLGSLDYYNGTIAGGTGADALSLSVELTFDGGADFDSFDYSLNLINSPNLPDGTPAESADYVQFGNIYAEVPATFGGIEYTLIIEFGETDGGGFTSLDEFFVYEDETASGSLYGTLVRAWGDGGGEG